jgi:hypothetical protein
MKKYVYVVFILVFGLSIVNSLEIIPELKNYYDGAIDYFYYEKYHKDILDSNLSNDELKCKLSLLVNNPKYISYNEARYELYSYVENYDGFVSCVYTDLKIETNKIPNPNIMNTEHTFPQSWFFGDLITYMKSDLHGLKPSQSRANSIRGNNPYGIVENIKHNLDDSLSGTDKHNNNVFEPADKSKGQIARIMFYWSIRYNWNIPGDKEELFRNWHSKYPVTELEILRNSRIEDIIGTRNPFIDEPNLVNKIIDF